MPGVDQPDSELQLIQEAIAGDKQAFGRLYDCYADQIFRYLYFRVEERSLAVDMTEDVFLKAWEKIPQFGKDKRGLNFRAWLYRIAHNTVIDYYRTNKAEVSLDEVSEYHDKMPAAIQLIEESEEIQELMVPWKNWMKYPGK
jgi:RNA polymerase sigma-70 factor (ECF subfamily)